MSAAVDIARLEAELDSFDPAVRRAGREALEAAVARGEVVLPHPGTDLNIHCHSFFSYNAYGYSPTKLAWLGRKNGWAVAGLVDFDALDGLEEFLEAGRAWDLKACAGIETRVFIPECSDFVMNSPGEPGISYHMGVGIPKPVGPESGEFLRGLRRISEQRNRELVARVNAYLDPVTLDYDREVLPLSPAGNATERHICLAYAQRAQAVLPKDELAAFWSARLGVEEGALDLPAGPKLQGLIRARTMKQGGVGYVQPDRGSFPKQEEMNRFILEAGGLPTHTWLDGTSEGERRVAEVLAVSMSTGVVALNVIPDRNYGSAGEEKLANLYEVVEIARGLDLLLVAGTEMNSPGQKLVDDWSLAGTQPAGAVLPGIGLRHLRALRAAAHVRTGLYERVGGRAFPEARGPKCVLLHAGRAPASPTRRLALRGDPGGRARNTSGHDWISDGTAIAAATTRGATRGPRRTAPE